MTNNHGGPHDEEEEEEEEYKRSKRPNKTENPYRVGPMAMDEIKNTTGAEIATLDSDIDDLELEKNRKNLKIEKNQVRTGIVAMLGEIMNMSLGVSGDKSGSLRASRSLLKYFAKLGKDENPDALVDLNYIRNHLANGADINFPDKQGQTVLFEVARGIDAFTLHFVILLVYQTY